MNGDSQHLRLAGVTTVGMTPRRGPNTAFFFDPHRLALPCWALALEGREPALLVTLDRHLDQVPPQDVAAIPRREDGLRALDEHARWHLSTRNDDHVIAAMEAGLIGDVVAIARTRLSNVMPGTEWLDRAGRSHHVLMVPTVQRLSDGFLGAPTTECERLQQWLSRGGPVILDVDLDCFTTQSDADPTTVIPWPAHVVEEFLMPEGADAFWDAILARCVALTFAREAFHCGGLRAEAELFRTVVEVLFGRVLGVPPP
ncbi:MAG: hypothetical protein AB2A00_24660 [Myxococcota bacterium]